MTAAAGQGGPAAASPEAARLRRLGWRCRRGMRELDVLLSSYLEREYVGSSAAQQAAFESLLELPDPVIADYLLAGAVPADPALAALAARLSRRASDGSW